MTNDQYSYFEKRLSQIEKRFDDIETLKGHSIAFDAKLNQIKDEILRFKQELKDISEELDKESNKVSDLLKDPDKGIYPKIKSIENTIETKNKEMDGRISILDTKTKALELKFDARIDNFSPDMYHLKEVVKTLKIISGERLEKLESAITQKERQNVWFERVLSAALAAGFSILVALLKDCNQ